MKTNLFQNIERLEQVTASCIANWKRGNDPGCLEDFIQVLEHLELIVDCQFNSFIANNETIITIIHQLDHNVRNKDMIAIIDLLEYDFIPLIRKWKQLDIQEKG